MRRDDLLDYLRRDRSLVDRSRDAYWSGLRVAHGPAEGIRIADQLRRQVLAARPDYPSDGDREEDLASHRRVAEMLARVATRRAG